MHDELCSLNADSTNFFHNFASVSHEHKSGLEWSLVCDPVCHCGVYVCTCSWTEGQFACMTKGARA